ncbi:Ras-related protein Rap-2a [Sciurus carolinensis]|uniref:Ras-related protein Rap-2a n=1 Tax=Sciurus carolinensis TaxID=30640 RepID=A0AA41TDG4_SCICA|nr:Ras-related protein Rap-2a [Sciurus carolinensis]
MSRAAAAASEGRRASTKWGTGLGRVGKSALTLQFVTGTFMEKYDSTIHRIHRGLLPQRDRGGLVASFQDIKPMRDQIMRMKRYEKVPVILVGNKVDLESEQEVSSNEGRALAEEWGCPFMETSAKSKTTGGRILCRNREADELCCSA